MYVCLCAVSPVASCSHGWVVRLTVCESDDPSSNPAHCSFFPLFFIFLSLLAREDICAVKLATWGVGPDVIYMNKKFCLSTRHTTYSWKLKLQNFSRVSFFPILEIKSLWKFIRTWCHWHPGFMPVVHNVTQCLVLHSCSSCWTKQLNALTLYRP